MAKSVIAWESPFAVELAPGACWWCHGERSKNQLFCGGPHQTVTG